MSAIASFYLVRNEDVPRLKDLATQPVGPAAGGKWHDPYGEFLVANALALERYNWSGYVIESEVCFYLESRSAGLNDHSDRELSDYLSNLRQGCVFVFPAEDARNLATLIESNWPDEPTLAAFLDSPPDMPAPSEEIEAVSDGLRILKSWLSQVDEHHVGLLNIG